MAGMVGAKILSCLGKHSIWRGGTYRQIGFNIIRMLMTLVISIL